MKNAPWGTRGAVVAALGLVACGHPNDASQAAPSHAVSIPLVAYTTKYPNGFELITDEDHTSPTVAVNLSYRVGSRDDPPGRAGLAHLVEHLMFRGSKHVPMGELESRVRGVGGSYNAETTLDRTVYWEHLPAHQLPLALWLESDRLMSPLETIDEATLATERDVVKNEWRQRAGDVEGGDVLAQTRGALFPQGHPYHSLPIGTPEDLDRVTLDEVRAFARRYYVPGNATLALVGDVDREVAIKGVTHWFGSLPKAAVPTRATLADTPIPRLHGVTRLEVEAGVEHPQVAVSWVGPSRYGDDDAEVDEYFDFLTAALRGWLVVTDHLARTVTRARMSGELGSDDTLLVTLADGTKADAVIDAVDKLLSETRGTRMTPASVDFERLRHVSGIVYSLESFDSRAAGYNDYREAAGRALFAPTLIARYDAVRAPRVRDIKARWFPDDARVITVVHPVEGAPLAGRLVGSR